MSERPRILCLNGRFVPEEQAVVSVFDRGFLYGDGLFETLLVRGGRPFRWMQHLERLQRGAAFLNIHLPHSPGDLARFADELIARNQMPEGLLRLTLSRGVGPRGYSPRGAEHPVLVLSLHPLLDPVAGGVAPASQAPPRWRLITASPRLPAGEPLAQFKTCNKLAQVLARAEADAAGADEALLSNTEGWIVEASSGNLFWMEGATVCTPPLASGILPGVTRGVVLELCGALGIPTREADITAARLADADGVFLSLSSPGIVEAESLDGIALARCPVTARLHAAYQELVGRESR